MDEMQPSVGAAIDLPVASPCVDTPQRASPLLSSSLAIEPHHAELRGMVDRVEARVRVARILTPPGDQRERIREAAALAGMAIDAIARGTLGYALITARV